MLGQTRHSRLPRLQLAKSHSSGVVDVLKDLTDTAQNELDHTRHDVLNVLNFAMARQSLDQPAKGKRTLAKAKADQAECATALTGKANLAGREFGIQRRLRLPSKAVASA